MKHGLWRIWKAEKDDIIISGRIERQSLPNARIYKERTKRWHDKRIKSKEFKSRDKVLL